MRFTAAPHLLSRPPELRGWLPQFVINSAMGSNYAGFFGGVLKELQRG